MIGDNVNPDAWRVEEEKEDEFVDVRFVGHEQVIDQEKFMENIWCKPLFDAESFIQHIKYNTTVVDKAIEKIQDKLTEEQELAIFATNFQEMLEEAIQESLENELEHLQSFGERP